MRKTIRKVALGFAAASILLLGACSSGPTTETVSAPKSKDAFVQEQEVQEREEVVVEREAPPAEDGFVGQWVVTEMADEADADVKEQLETLAGIGIEMVIALAANGDASIELITSPEAAAIIGDDEEELLGEMQSGTWRALSDDEVELSWQGGDTYSLTLRGNQLVLDEHGVLMVLDRV